MDYERIKRTFEALPFMQAAKCIKVSKYHNYDLNEHICETADHLIGKNSSLDLVAAGYLHDIGKVALATPKGNGVFSIGQDHAKVGGIIVRHMSTNFFESLDLDQNSIAYLVTKHEEPLKKIIELRNPGLGFDIFLRKLHDYKRKLNQEVLVEEIIGLFWADTVAKGGCPDFDELRMYYDYFTLGNISLKKLYKNRMTDQA